MTSNSNSGELNLNPEGSFAFGDVAVYNNEVFFFGLSASGVANEYGLWFTSVTTGGTYELGGTYDIGVAGALSTGLGGVLDSTPVAFPAAEANLPILTAVTGGILFDGFDSSGDLGLWFSNGSAAGTYEIGGIADAGVAGASKAGLTPHDIVSFTLTSAITGATTTDILFAASDYYGNVTLWTTDGTAAGTTMVGGMNNAGINGAESVSGGGGFNPQWLTATNGGVFFSGSDNANNIGLWFSNGAAAGTYEVGGIADAGVAGAYGAGLSPAYIAAYKNGVLFNGLDKVSYHGLWFSDGTAAGTYEIGGIADAGVAGAGHSGLDPTDIAAFGGGALFSGTDASGHSTLWYTDGTAAGTREIGVAGSSNPQPSDLTVVNNEAFFLAVDANGQQSLWVTNGATTGTSEIGGLDNAGIANANSTGFMPADISVYDGEAMFVATDAQGNRNFWVTDGTVAGTHEIIDGNGSNDILTGSNAIFWGGSGHDQITGTGGINTVVYDGLASQYTITGNLSGMTVTDTVANRDGADTLINIQQLKFTDYTLVFDLTSAEDTLVYELYQATYGRTPDNAGFRYWAQYADATHASALALADIFLAAAEFTQKYGSNPSNTQYVTELYTNVLQRTPDQAGLNYWIGEANAGTPRDQLLVDFATSTENVNLIAPHVSNGFWTI
ncbi:MAG: DUF4214 domain-containing protein [Methylocystis sp.]